MKSQIRIVLSIAVFFILGSMRFQEKSYPDLDKPTNSPKIFARGVISSKFHEHSALAISPDFKTIIWNSVFTPGQRNFSPKGGNLVIYRTDDGWSEPVFFKPLDPLKDWEACYSPDGKRIFFGSTRSYETDPGIKKIDSDIWYMEKVQEEWLNPVPLPKIINTENYEMQPTVALNGNLYYVGYWEGGRNGYGIYRSRFLNGNYAKPKLLPESINTKYLEWTPFIAPDESYIIFSSNRPGGFGSGDLYISYKLPNNEWSEAVNLGNKVNTGFNERFPSVSPDGKYLFFISDSVNNIETSIYTEVLKNVENCLNGYNNFYWISFDSIK